MSTPNGGPAFPYAFQHEDDNRFQSQGVSLGMTLRDYFAGQALAAMTPEYIAEYPNKWTARNCYELADAMLAEREARK